MLNIDIRRDVRFGRHVLGAAIAAVTLGLPAAPDVTAAPANGRVISQAAAATSPAMTVPCAVRRVCGYRGCVSRHVCW